MLRTRSGAVACSAILAFTTLLAAAGTTTRPDAGTPAAKPAILSLDKVVHAQSTAILDTLEKDGDFAAATAHVDALIDQVAAVGTDKTLDAFRDAAFARRLVHQLAGVPQDKRIDLLKYLRAHDTLARTMTFMINPEGEHGVSAAAPYAVLLELRDKFGDQIDKYANLTTALCVVHDKPFTRQINENNTTAPSATDLFAYYTTNEKSMLFGIKNVPPELLVYVVDTTASIEDMTWALKKYAGDTQIGRHFFDVAYDYASFRQGTKKKVDDAGYTLPNILKYGGVCADQAFFATELGKAIGVPTAYTTGRSAEVGHAWVGFLQAAADRVVWNFDEGRYAEYRGIRGEVVDPQTRQRVPDAFISLQAELMGTTSRPVKPADRQAAAALTDAAVRVGELEGGPFAPQTFDEKLSDALKPARKAGVEGALELLKSAVLENRGYPRPWYAVWAMTKEGKLSMAQKKEWRDAVLSACAAKYPDFAVLLLEPIIDSVEDPIQQNQWWEAAFHLFETRSDLAADIRMHQAKLWEDQNQPAKAGQCYEDVINRFANAGPFVLKALAGAEKLLNGKPDKVLKLYEQTFAKVTKPQQSAFMEQSNWYHIGQIYAAKLKEAGKTKEADAVLSQLGTGMASGG